MFLVGELFRVATTVVAGTVLIGVRAFDRGPAVPGRRWIGGVRQVHVLSRTRGVPRGEGHAWSTTGRIHSA